MCTKPFTVSAHQGLRYLDASDSGMTPAHLTNNSMLIHLDLSHCGFSRVGTLSFPNLNSLDLSDNLITEIKTDQLYQSSHLKVLILSGNPLASLFTNSSVLSPAMDLLKTLDLSRVTLLSLNIDISTLFPQIQILNLSSTGIQRVEGSGSAIFSKLHTLDLHGCPVDFFPRKAFRTLQKLHTIYVDNYKLCCSVVLPVDFNIKNCHGPSDNVSTCDSLLGQILYQTLFVIFAVVSLICCLAFFIWTVVAKNAHKSAAHIFHVHLTTSDFVMGVHVTIVAAADQTYRGTYLWEDTAWRHSIMCQVSGFLYVLSTAVSALLTCLMTLDRCAALRCPQRHGRVGTVATHAGCAVVWAGCVLLAAVPLMPGTSLWKLYGQTGVCQPLVSLLEGSTSQEYNITVLVGLTLTLLLVTCVAQLYLAMLVSQHSDILTALKTNGVESDELTVARRVSPLLLFDVVCWSWLCLVMVLTSAGVSMSTLVQVGTAMGCLPLKAALNPVMYLAGCLQERQRNTQRQRLLQRLGIAKQL